MYVKELDENLYEIHLSKRAVELLIYATEVYEITNLQHYLNLTDSEVLQDLNAAIKEALNESQH